VRGHHATLSRLATGHRIGRGTEPIRKAGMLARSIAVAIRVGAGIFAAVYSPGAFAWS